MENYYLEDISVIDLLNEAEELENLQIRHIKRYKPRFNPLEDLREDEFRIKYRFTKENAVFIIDLIKDQLAIDTRGGGIPPYLQVLIAIRAWGRGEFQDDAGDISGVSQPTVSIICKKVALALVQLREQFLKMPQSEHEQNNTISEFYSICGFRQVIGAIDCTHIRIPKISGNMGQYYINRKGYCSLNVQTVCNAKLVIMDIVAQWRGSTHDARIFNESRVKSRFENNEFKVRLLGDSGYACSPYLYTPVLNPRTPKEESFNYAHIRTRNTIERCFGVWKQRFRCLLRGFTNSLDNTKLYIVALAILHNISIIKGDLLVEENIEVEEVEVAPAVNNNLRGNVSRTRFIEENF